VTVGGYDGSFGNFELSVSCSSDMPSPTPSPAGSYVDCGSGTVQVSTVGLPNYFGDASGDYKFALNVYGTPQIVTISTCASTLDATNIGISGESINFDPIFFSYDSSCNNKNHGLLQTRLYPVRC
jgi:hypothetical protein